MGSPYLDRCVIFMAEMRKPGLESLASRLQDRPGRRCSPVAVQPSPQVCARPASDRIQGGGGAEEEVGGGTLVLQ